jgi:acetyltransferase
MSADRWRDRIRMLTVSDCPALRTFSCASIREPWSDAIEELVREALPRSIEEERVVVLGAIGPEDKLVGVCTVGAPDERKTAWSSVVATTLGYRKQGVGTSLKLASMRVAREAGAVAIASLVFMDNEGMLLINTHLGADIRMYPADPDYRRCVIRL